MQNLTWKSITIVAVLVACAGMLWPPSEKLKPSIDLAGGTSLLYKIDTAGEVDPESTIKQTIQVLQDRVDPQGVMNLVWRVESGSRIEIQMPLPGKNVLELRDALQKLIAEVEAQAISRSEIQAALRLEGPAREQALANLVRGVPGRAEALQAAAGAYDNLQSARAALAQTTEGTAAHVQAAGAVARAELAFEDAMAAVEATVLGPVELQRTLELSDKAKPGEVSPRQRGIERLISEHPSVKEQIQRIAAAYEAYQKVKGPLDDPQDLIRLLKGAGVLEFRIAATPGAVSEPEIQQLRQRLIDRGPRGFPADAPLKWFVVDEIETWADNPAELQALQADAGRYFAERRGLIAQEYGGDVYLLLYDTPGKSITQKQPNWELSQVTRQMDERGFPAVGFAMNEAGAALMGNLTETNLGQPMAIVLDNRVYQAPTIQARITGSGIITGGKGGFNPQEMDYLIRTLSAGSLKARLSEEPIAVRVIGPSLGADNLLRGLESARDAIIAVAVFMFIYYFFAGMVANFALLANVIVILGVMAGLGATFTLPGIAGIVLTIGMCVDANVLVFERIREELNRGANMGAALRLGYQKAMSAIIDGNLTNLIVCFILYYTATADVKGFAVTLGIGIVATLFTAVFMTRLIFEVWHRLLPNQKLKMLPIVFPVIDRVLTPKIDWYGLRKVFYTVSAVILLSSIGLVAARGIDMLDIEFRSGTEVSFDLADGKVMALAEARERLAATGLPDYQVIPLDAENPLQSHAFSVVTTESDPDTVAAAVRNAFAGLLDVKPVISFRGIEAAPAEAPVYPVTRENLGQVINRPGVEDRVGDFVGGAAIVLDELRPAVTLAELEQRIRFMRGQPDYQDLQFRRFRVVGLSPDPQTPGHYTSAAVLVADENINYFEDPSTWESALAAEEFKLVRDALSRESSFSKVTNFDPTVAQTLTNQAIVAMLLSLIAISFYIWVRFGSLRYGMAAAAALIHDVIWTLGFLALSGFLYDTFLGHALLLDPFKINMAVIAALLTLVGYSLNDTIIVFDRIREVRGRLGYLTPQIINDAINQTISRTALTGGTTFLAIVFMYTFGGPGIHGFAFAMTVGVVVGTYSSVAIAAPILLMGAGGKGGPRAEAPKPTASKPEPART